MKTVNGYFHRLRKTDKREDAGVTPGGYLIGQKDEESSSNLVFNLEKRMQSERGSTYPVRWGT